MITWLTSMVSPMALTAMEIFLLRYLVYGLRGDAWEQERDPNRVYRLLTWTALFLLGVFLRTHRPFGGNAGIGAYVNLFVMALFYYLVLIFYLRINRSLSVYYLVIFDIPADVCDLVVFVLMLRNGGVDVSDLSAPLGPTCLYLLLSFVFRFVVLTLVRHFLDDDRHRKLSGMQLFLITIAVVPFLYIRNLGFWLPLGNDDIGYTSMMFLGVTGVISLILVIGNERIVYYHMQRSELLQMQSLIRHQHEQYEMRKEAVNLVNQKYHDMRHQLVGILGMEDVQQIHSYVRSLRQELQSFESLFRTGNQLMDIILSQKAEECQKKKIQLVPTVDGQALSMLEATDLCTIFGNALDNAIESCEKVAEENLRRITLKVCTVQGFLAIYVENPCTEEPRSEGGRFLTTKRDAENHGYGLQGIRQAAEKYQGEMEARMEEGCFTLTILIPLP